MLALDAALLDYARLVPSVQTPASLFHAPGTGNEASGFVTADALMTQANVQLSSQANFASTPSSSQTEAAPATESSTANYGNALREGATSTSQAALLPGAVLAALGAANLGRESRRQTDLQPRVVVRN